MLILMTLSMVMASLVIVFVKKNQESLLLLGLCISLAMEICGVMILLQKKVGFRKIFSFFSISPEKYSVRFNI